MKNETQNSELLDHVEPQRRKFLAKLIAAGAALPVMTSVALGQPQQDGQGKGGFGGKGKGGFQGKGNMSGKGGFGGKGQGGFQGKGNMSGKGKGGFGGGSQDPAELAAKLLKEFDKDGDKALNLKELTAALKSVGENRGMMGGAGKGKGGGAGKGGFGKGGGAGKGGFGKGKGGGQEGAVKPQRPGSE